MHEDRLAGAGGAAAEVEFVERRDREPVEREAWELEGHRKAPVAWAREGVGPFPELRKVGSGRALGGVDERAAERGASREAVDPGNRVGRLGALGESPQGGVEIGG